MGSCRGAWFGPKEVFTLAEVVVHRSPGINAQRIHNFQQYYCAHPSFHSGDIGMPEWVQRNPGMPRRNRSMVRSRCQCEVEEMSVKGQTTVNKLVALGLLCWNHAKYRLFQRDIVGRWKGTVKGSDALPIVPLWATSNRKMNGALVISPNLLFT